MWPVLLATAPLGHQPGQYNGCSWDYTCLEGDINRLWIGLADMSQLSSTQISGKQSSLQLDLDIFPSTPNMLG